MNMESIQTFLGTTAIDVGLKVLAAIAFWIIGRWMIGRVIALMQAAMNRNHVDPTLTKYLGSIIAIALNIALVLGILGYFGIQTTSFAAMLAGAGVPILRALQAAAETLGNRAMRADAMDALVLVREGAPLASALAQKKRFPGLLAMFSRLGEQTGQLPVMLDRAAKQLGTEVQRRAMQLATILEPLLIVAMGLVVMLIVLAVLLPIIQLNQWVR